MGALWVGVGEQVEPQPWLLHETTNMLTMSQITRRCLDPQAGQVGGVD